MSPLEQKLLVTSRIDDATFKKVSYITKKYGGTVSLNLIRTNALEEEELLNFIIENFGTPETTMEELKNIKMNILNLIPSELAKRFRIIPFGVEDDVIKVVLSDPTDLKIIGEIEYITGRRVIAHAALESIISWALLKYYGVITESASELPRVTIRDIPEENEENGEIPIPLVTRKKEGILSSGNKTEKEEKIDTLSKAELPEMGDWDAPFKLSRISSTEIKIDKLSEIEKKSETETLKDEKKKFRRKTPTKMAIPGPEKAEEIKTQASPEVQEPTVTPKVKEIPEAIDEYERKKVLPERGSSISIAPVYIIGSDTTIADRITEKSDIEGSAREEKSIKPSQKQTFPPSRLSGYRQERTKTIDKNRVTRWASYISSMRETDRIIDASLTFLDAVFGPTIFMRIKKHEATPYSFSPSVSKSHSEKLKNLKIEYPAFKQMWESLEKGHFYFGKIEVTKEIKGIIDINIDSGWEEKPLILIIPIIIGRAKAGSILSVPTSDWKETPDLHEVFKTIEYSLSKAFETIIIEKKKGLQ